ncbi:MAG: AI-2E family transporter [Burkholderiales bacterium]|nr:AI-2E family transporter [Burkholderiales bacterium]
MKTELDLKISANESVKASVSGADPAPIRVRNGWIVVLTVLVALYMLHWASPILIPIVLGVMTSYAFSPVVNAMEKWHIHRAIGAAVLLIGIVAGVGALVYSLGDETAEIIETLPDSVQKMRQALSTSQGDGAKAVEKVQKAATELEQAAIESGTVASPAPRGVTLVQIEKPRVNIRNYLWSGTMGLVTFIGQLVTVLFFAYFLMTAGDVFRRKLVKISPTLSEKKITVEVLNGITQQIQRYLLVQVFTSVLVGVVSWLAFLALGLEHAAIWGIAAGVLNSVPYFGPIVVSTGIALVALVQFGSLGMALWVASVALVITSIEGLLLTPWLIGRAGSMSTVVVFTSVILGGWLWGPWGLLLAVPVLMIIKSVCDHVEDLKPVGELLGD